MHAQSLLNIIIGESEKICMLIRSGVLSNLQITNYVDEYIQNPCNPSYSISGNNSNDVNNVTTATSDEKSLAGIKLGELVKLLQKQTVAKSHQLKETIEAFIGDTGKGIQNIVGDYGL